eukprot:scaffold31990_cov76-Amphora_coffeaeformis.AAC.1
MEDVLPWTTTTTPASAANNNNNTILIADRVASSGRFLLFVTVAHAVRCNDGTSILWLNFSSGTNDALIRQGLKKLGCLLATTNKKKKKKKKKDHGDDDDDDSSTTIFTDATGR